MENQLRIAQVLGEMNGYGVENVVMNYYRYIDRSRVQFDFIVHSDSTRVPVEEITALGGRLYTVPPYQQLSAYLRALIKLFRENRYEIVHAHLNTMSVFPLFAAKCAGVPVRIAHSHSTAANGETARNILKYALRPFSKVFATNYAACSRYAGEWFFGKKAMERGEVKIIYNAIDLDQFRYNEEVRNDVRHGLEIEGRFVIGHVGRFIFQKNQEFLIDIFEEVYKRNPDAVLLLIGDGKDKPMIETKVKQLPCCKSVRFLGNRADVAHLYQAMDVFALPSRYEGLPVVAVEAQAAGLPCVFSDRVTTEAKLTDLVSFMSLDDGAAAWADVLLAEHSGSGENERSLSRFDIKAQAAGLADFYSDLIETIRNEDSAHMWEEEV